MKTPTLALTFAIITAGAAMAQAESATPTTADRDSHSADAIRLEIDATDTARHIIAVRETIPVAKAGPLTLFYPQWLPGKHAPRGPIEKLAGLKITAVGETLRWTRDPVDVYAFKVVVPPGVSELEVAFQYLSPTAANQGRIEVTPEMLNLQWNAVVLYPAGREVRQITVEPRVRLPEGWGYGSALRQMSGHGGVTRFEPVSLETLVDSPIFAGRYYRQYDLDPGGHSSVRLNVVAETADDLVADAKAVEKHRSLVRQADRLFGARHFDHYDFLLAIGERMGRIGLEHHRSSESKVNAGYFTDFAGAVDDRDLLAHEYVHSWNGKFRRPADLWAADYNTPTRGSLLWVYEGQTQYWGYVLGARSGMLSRQEALDALAATAAAFQNRIGRRWRPLADTTDDPVIAARRPEPWSSWQRNEDYYSEGQLIWLDVDTLIRDRSGGKRSLDDFARRFFGGHDGDFTPSLYTFEDLVAALNAVEPYDWATFLHARVDEIAPKAPLDGLARGGYRLVYSETQSGYLASVEAATKTASFSYSIGLTLNREGEITLVQWDSPAFEAGLTVSTKVLSVNALAYTADRLRAAITEAKTGKPVSLIVRDVDHFRTVELSYSRGLRYPKLERVDGPDLLSRVFEPLAH